METPEATTQIQRLQAVYDQLAATLQQPAVTARLRQTTSESAWSAMQTLGHTVEMIPYWLHHCQTLIAATGAPPAFGRTHEAPERLAGIAQGATSDPVELLAQLQQVIATASDTMRAMSAADRAKRGIHNRRGEISVAEVLEIFVVAHAEEHLVQIQQALAEV